MINYNGKKFRPKSQSDNSETSDQTIFYYQQEDGLLTASYSGGLIRHGHLIGTVDDQGCIDMRYHHMTISGELKTGECQSKPELLPDGRIELHESWKWTSGDFSSGESVLIEI